jgi:hypothetical protein
MTRGWFNGLVFLVAGVATGGQGILAAELIEAPEAAEVGLDAKMPGPRPDDAKPATTIARQPVAGPHEGRRLDAARPGPAERSQTEAGSPPPRTY